RGRHSAAARLRNGAGRAQQHYLVGIATNQMSTYPAAMREAVKVPAPDRQIRNVPANLANLYVLTHAGVAADRQIMQLLNPSNTPVVVGGHDHLSLSTEYQGH